jgi:RnfABCDGE-type electron transport complex G subunit
MRDSLRLVIVLTLVATLSGGILAYTWDKITPIIEANNAAALAESILEVMPGAAATSTVDADTTATATAAADSTGSSTADADATASGTVDSVDAGAAATGTSDADATASGTADADATASGTVDGTSGSSVVADVHEIYRGLDANGNTAAIAFVVDASGYGGTIRMIVGVDPATRKLTQVKVLEHSETPGLGARITEPAFLRQFENKSIDDAFAAKQDVDAIAGATVSTIAVASTIKAALSEVETELRAGGAW